jgi:hypothetical protein
VDAGLTDAPQEQQIADAGECRGRGHLADDCFPQGHLVGADVFDGGEAEAVTDVEFRRGLEVRG